MYKQKDANISEKDRNDRQCFTDNFHGRGDRDISMAGILMLFLQRRRRALQRESFVVVEWSDSATGSVAEPGILTEPAQDKVREEMDRMNSVGKRCELADGEVSMPLEWRPTDFADTCALDMTNIAIRNRCDKGRNSFIGDANVVSEMYIDPKTLTCNVRFREDVDVPTLNKYKKRVDIGRSVREVFEMRRTRDRLQAKIDSLVAEIEQLENDIRKEQAELDGLMTRLRSRRARKERLESTLDGLERDISVMEREIKLYM